MSDQVIPDKPGLWWWLRGDRQRAARRWIRGSLPPIRFCERVLELCKAYTEAEGSAERIDAIGAIEMELWDES